MVVFIPSCQRFLGGQTWGNGGAAWGWMATHELSRLASRWSDWSLWAFGDNWAKKAQLPIYNDGLRLAHLIQSGVVISFVLFSFLGHVFLKKTTPAINTVDINSIGAFLFFFWEVVSHESCWKILVVSIHQWSQYGATDGRNPANHLGWC